MAKRAAKTRKDDLHTGHPYWLSTRGTSVRVRSTPGAGRFDVIIVGAGISGALQTEALTRAGKRVLTFDRRAPVRGSMSASTASAESYDVIDEIAGRAVVTGAKVLGVRRSDIPDEAPLAAILRYPI